MDENLDKLRRIVKNAESTLNINAMSNRGLEIRLKRAEHALHDIIKIAREDSDGSTRN